MDISEIRKRMERATPGPWTLRPAQWQCDCGGNEAGYAHETPDGCPEGYWLEAAWVDGIAVLEFSDGFTGLTDADADFMAHAREDIPALCDALAAEQKEAQGWRKHAIDMQNAAERYDAKCRAAETALAEYKANTPWESMWMYFSHGDYGPDAWQEVDEWLRTNMPQEMARTWLGMPEEVQP